MRQMTLAINNNTTELPAILSEYARSQRRILLLCLVCLHGCTVVTLLLDKVSDLGKGRKHFI